MTAIVVFLLLAGAAAYGFVRTLRCAGERGACARPGLPHSEGDESRSPPSSARF